MSHSNLCDAVPFQFLSSCVAGETITPWDCHKFPHARADSTVTYPMDTEVLAKLILPLLETDQLCPQISLMMTHGYIHPGWVNAFQEVEWRKDLLVNCHNMGTLWGFTIRAGEQCHMLVPANLRDPILWRLLKVGI